MVNKAITFAVKAHEGQLRKGTDIPYIVHPMEVCAIVARMTTDRELMAAAILHDTVEDCKDVSLEQIQEIFGARVAMLVSKESEDKSRSWQERKQTTIDHLKVEESQDVLILALADKLSNIRSLYHDYRAEGENVWMRFRMKDKAMQAWYYKGLRNSLKESMSQYEEYREFSRLVSEVFD